jgi:WD40 repeat protein
MQCVTGGKLDSWRWRAGVVAICVIVLLAALLLQRKGWTVLSIVLQVLTGLAALVGIVLTWMRGQRTSPEVAVSSHELPALLQAIAEAHEVSDTALRAALGRRDTDAVLAGTQLPTWDFVTAFVDVIAGGDRAVGGILEDLIRPVWKAACTGPAGDHGTPDVAVAVQVAGQAGVWVTVNQQAAAAGQAAGHLQQAADQLEHWRDALVSTLKKYSQTIRTLTAERDQLSAELTAQRADVQQRLARAQQLQEQTSQRLTQTEHKLEVAEQLRDEAVTQVGRFQAQLAELENRPAPSAIAIAPPPDSDPHRLMGLADQQLGEAILHRTDDFLRVQDSALSQQAATIDELRQADADTGTAGIRRGNARRYALASTVLVLAGGASAAAFTYFHTTGADSDSGRGHPGHIHAVTASRSCGQPESGRPSAPDMTGSLHIPGYVPESVALTKNGKTAAVGAFDSNSNQSCVYLWSVASHTLAASWRIPGSQQVNSVAFSQNGAMLAAGSADGSSYVWIVATGKLIAHPSGQGSLGVRAVAFSPSGTTLAAGDQDGTVYLWKLAPHGVTAKLHYNTITGVDTVAFNTDGTLLADADGYDGNVYLWNVPGSTTKPVIMTKQESLNVESVAFSPDSPIIAAGDNDGNIYLFNLATHQPISPPLSDPGQSSVESVAFLPDGVYLVAGAHNGTAYLWNLESHSIVTGFHVSAMHLGVISVAVSRDGTTLATSDHSGTTYFWRLP